MQRAENYEGRPLIATHNIAMARAIHPAVGGMATVPQLRRCGVRGRVAMAEAGPEDSINHYVEQIVYASTDTNAPTQEEEEDDDDEPRSGGYGLASTNEPIRGV